MLLGKFIFRSTFGQRLYFTASRDPNIRNEGKAFVGQLKRAVYSKSPSSVSTKYLMASLKEKIPKMETVDVLEVSYLLTRMNRKEGWILDSRLAIPILANLKANIAHLNRDQQIRLIQVCSLSVSREKLKKSSNPSFEIVDRLRRDIVHLVVGNLQNRISDLPTSALGALVSSLARQYDISMEFFLRSICILLTNRIQKTIARNDDVSAFLVRSDLQRTIPYIMLAHIQNNLPIFEKFRESSLEIFSTFPNEVSYEHLSLFLHTLGHPIPQILLEYISRIPPDELSVLDICRLIECGCDFLVPSLLSNPTWTIHGIVQFSQIIDKVEDVAVIELFKQKYKITVFPKVLGEQIKRNMENARLL